MDELRAAWTCSMFFLPIYLDPDWQQRGVVAPVAAGSGCTLIRRDVL